jgi:serine/threonine protein kinase
MAGGDPVGHGRPPGEPADDDDEVTNEDPRPPVPAATPEPELGEVIEGYELVELLGQGGAGSVFRAVHAQHGEVALKILATSKLSRARVVRRFRDEAEIASSVRHPALVEFVQLVEQSSPRRLAYAMELVRGLSLREKLQHVNVLALTEAIHIAKQMCLGVATLHDVGIVHRDLKPENVMLIEPERAGQQTRIKILDFGVAKHLHQPEASAPAMAEVPGTFVGTPRYMAPEQAAGGDVDGRADLFAIGVMLFEMITGQRPHEGDTLKAVVMAKLKGAPRLTMNPDRELLPQELADIVDACLKLQPDLRPRDARSVAARLDEAEMVLAAVGSVRLDNSTKLVRATTSMGPPPRPVGSERPAAAVAMPSIPPAVSGPSLSARPAPSLAVAAAGVTPPLGVPAGAVPVRPQTADGAARRRTTVAAAAVVAALVTVVVGAWVVLGDDPGNVLIGTPPEGTTPVQAATPTTTPTTTPASPAAEELRVPVEVAPEAHDAAAAAEPPRPSATGSAGGARGVDPPDVALEGAARRAAGPDPAPVSRDAAAADDVKGRAPDAAPTVTEVIDDDDVDVDVELDPGHPAPASPPPSAARPPPSASATPAPSAPKPSPKPSSSPSATPKPPPPPPADELP